MMVMMLRPLEDMLEGDGSMDDNGLIHNSVLGYGFCGLQIVFYFHERPQI